MKFHWRLGGIVFVAIVVISFPARASPPATQDSALEFAKDHKSTLKSPGAINDHGAGIRDLRWERQISDQSHVFLGSTGGQSDRVPCRLAYGHWGTEPAD